MPDGSNEVDPEFRASRYGGVSQARFRRQFGLRPEVGENACSVDDTGPDMPHVEVLNSAEGGGFFKALLSEISAEGFGVHHRYALSDEAYRKSRRGLQKFVAILKMYAWYCLTACAKPLRKCTYISVTNPFFLPAAVRLRVGQRHPTIVLMYDLYPDALELAGFLLPQGWLSRLCGACTGFAIRNSSATVFLGEVLKEHIEARYGPAKHAVVIPVGADGRPFADSPPRKLERSQPVRIMYCGNLGRAHDTGTLLGYLKTSDNSSVSLHFHSFGSKYDQLCRSLSCDARGPRCRLSGPLDEDHWTEAMLAAHVALVTVSLGWEQVVMPSKTYSAMVAGQAILAICSAKSDLARLVLTHDCGWVVAPGDVEELRKVIDYEMLTPAVLEQKRQNSFVAGHKHYSCRALASRWATLLRGLN